MDLQYVFKSTNLKCVISIDDDWNYNSTPEAILYDLFQLSTQEKSLLFSEIKSCDANVAAILRDAIDELIKIGFTIEGKAKYEIYRYIENGESLEIIKKFDTSHIDKIENITQKYGVGLQSAGIISLKDTIATARNANIPIRIYTDFLDADKEHFEKTVSELTSVEGYVFCIIDDNMKKEKRADEIIKLIADNEDYQKKVACVLVTSGNNAEKTRYDSDIHIEFIKKKTSTTKDSIKDFNVELSMAYLKSLYRVMLANLQSAKKDAIDTVFKGLYSDVNTAVYISSMARVEGVTNFEMINKWISSKERNEIEEQKIDDIKNIISLSNVLNDLRESDSMNGNEGDAELYSNDAYDKTVNVLHKTIDVGDIFEINGSYYILIGQECDLGIRRNGKRKTEVLEFVEAKLYSSATEIVKHQFTYEQALISNFPTEDGSLKYLGVDCSKRYYGKPEMFDMCTYNDCGISSIDLNKPLDFKIKTLIPEGLIKLYGQIQQHFRDYTQVKEIVNDGRLFDAFLKTIGLSNENNQVLGYDGFSLNDNIVSYPIRRVCRLRKHAQLLHRMYLNYRGRQAEEAVCFSRYIEMDYNLGDFTYRAKCLLSSKTHKNVEELLYKRPWLVKAEDINEYLASIGNSPLTSDETYLCLTGTTDKQENHIFNKCFDSETKKHFLNIIKL